MTTLPSFREALKLWAYIGCVNFGGPAGQIALMHKLIVDERKWIGDARFFHALNYCMLLPGPEAQQLATYIGWLMHGQKGGLAAGLLFILPGAIVMLSLSILYVNYADLAVVNAIFYGVKAAVLAIVVESIFRIAKRAFTGAAMPWIAAGAFFALFFFAVPFPIVVLSAALTGFFGMRLAPAQFRASGHAAKIAVAEGAIDSAFARGEQALAAFHARIIRAAAAPAAGPAAATATGAAALTPHFSSSSFDSSAASMTVRVDRSSTSFANFDMMFSPEFSNDVDGIN